MAYEDYHVNADDVKLDGDPNIRRTVPPSPSGGGGGISYGTCTTAAATAAKVVTLTDATGWELKQGASIAVKFSNTNTFSATAQDPVTLNVNNTGAKNIYYGGSANPTGTNTTAFGRADYINTYVYDGTYWVWQGSSADNNTTYSAMSTSELTTGTATTSRVVRADYLHAGIEQIAESAKIDTANNTATFTSSDTTDASATSWTSVTKLASGESHTSIFGKMSQMFKNIRYLYKMLGTTDISSIGDGTVTGGLDTLKDALTQHDFGSEVDILSDATSSSGYTVPSDGYLKLQNEISPASSYATGTINGVEMICVYDGSFSVYSAQTIFVRAGMLVKLVNHNMNLRFRFIPLA